MKHYKRALLSLLSLATYLLHGAQEVSAQISNPVIGDLGSNATEASSGSTFARYFAYLWNTTVTVGGLIVLIYFIWAAFEWITAGSDSGKLEKARLKIIHASIGLIILVSSFTIVSFVGELFFDGQYSILRFEFSSPTASTPPTTP